MSDVDAVVGGDEDAEHDEEEDEGLKVSRRTFPMPSSQEIDYLRSRIFLLVEKPKKEKRKIGLESRALIVK